MRFHRQLTLWLAAGLTVAAGLALAGCGTPAMTATADPTFTVPVRVVLPTSTWTPSPTDLPLPTSTETAAPTSTSTPTPTPTPTMTPTLTPASAWDAALPLDAQMEDARRHQTNGDYDRAILAYQAILSGQPSAEQARQARYHLAECYLLNGDYSASAAAWEEFIAASSGDPLLPQAQVMAGRAYQAMADCVRAVPHYEAALALETVLADTINEWIGDCHTAGEEWDRAIAAYRRALSATDDPSTEAGLREKVAAAYLALKQVPAAVAEYDAILSIARKDFYRAQIEYLAGQALAADGQTNAAHARYRRAVDRYPTTEYAYLALVELVDAGAAVDEFQRGLVDYYAGPTYPDAYGAAIRAFDRYLGQPPAAKADEALYRKALAQRALGQTDQALATLDILIADHPRSQWIAAAWFEKAATLAAAGDTDQAVKSYQDMAAFFPAAELAPKALWQAAQLRDKGRAFASAARLYEDLQATFPAYENAEEALWRAGLAHYRAGARDRAVDDWRALLDKYPTSSYRFRCLYWLGKLGIRPERPGQTGYWDQLLRSSTHNYYALRARQVRSGESVTSTRLITAAIEPPRWEAAEAEADILKWLRGWTQVPTNTRLVDLPASLGRRADVRRGQALLAIGLRREALASLDASRSASWDDPLALAQLAFFFHDQGLHGLAARCASRLAGLWPGGAIYDAPPSLQRLAYPLAYADLLSAEAQARGLDPLLLAALIRQESLFEPAAESYAGARGLGQVMPATGEGIAKSLGMADFALDDLYRPWVSVRFGAFYLSAQLKRFDNQILTALAAYNGGPGNTLHWLEAAGDDLDLFVEVIGAEQSRRYLQAVYEQYLTYEALYRPGQAGG